MAFSENTKTEIQIRKFKAKTILIAAFYSRELSDALTASDSISELQSYLVDEDYNILYPDDEKSIGKNAVDVIADVTTGYDNYQLIGEENLIMMDMDNFKKVNDTLGHNAGDYVLQHSAELFSDVFSEYAVVGRMGGDEFTVYLERTDETIEQVRTMVEQDIQRLFELFRQAFCETYRECDLSLSAGAYISVKRTELNCNEMYKKADKALYISKENGKNQLNWYEEI